MPCLVGKISETVVSRRRDADKQLFTGRRKERVRRIFISESTACNSVRGRTVGNTAFSVAVIRGERARGMTVVVVIAAVRQSAVGLPDWQGLQRSGSQPYKGRCCSADSVIPYVVADDLDKCSPHLPRYESIAFFVLKSVDARSKNGRKGVFVFSKASKWNNS